MIKRIKLPRAFDVNVYAFKHRLTFELGKYANYPFQVFSITIGEAIDMDYISIFRINILGFILALGIERDD